MNVIARVALLAAIAVALCTRASNAQSTRSSTAPSAAPARASAAPAASPAPAHATSGSPAPSSSSASPASPARAASSSPAPSTPAASPAPAAASLNASAEADALIAHGVQLRAAGNDQAALADFRRAYELAPTPRARTQLGLDEQALGMWVEAEADIRGALTVASDPWIAAHLAVIQASLAALELHVGGLQVLTEPPGVTGTVLFNGVERARLPMPEALRVPAGQVTIELRAAGYRVAQRTIHVDARITYREAFLLQVDTSTHASASPAPGIQASAAPSSSPPPSASSSPPVETEASSSPLPAVGLAMIVAGAVVLLGGVGAHVYWQMRVAVYNDDSQCHYGALTRIARCGAVLDNANQAQLAMIAGYVAGGVVAIAGVVISIAAPRASHAAQRAGISCGSGPGDFGIACRVGF